MIMKASIYLLRYLLFPWLLMKMLLTILLKIPHNVTEVMVVPMVLLLALKLIRSGVPHKRMGGRGGGGWLYRTSIFWEGLLGKRGWPFFRRGCNFCVKNKSFSQSASSQTLDWVPNMPHSESKLKCYSAKFKDAKIASYSFHSLYHSYFLVHSQKYFKFFKKYH